MKTAKILTTIVFLSIFTIQITAQGSSQQKTSKNRDFAFSLTEKLKNLKLLSSTWKDIEKLFGENCEYGCKYKKDWWIYVEYVGENLYGKSPIDGHELVYMPKPEYKGKLLSVSVLYDDYSASRKPFPSEDLNCTKTVTYRIYENIKSDSYICFDGLGFAYFFLDKKNELGESYKDLYRISLSLSQEKFSEIFVTTKR